MNIPDSFKIAISETFYDKTFTVYEKSVTVDSEGGTSITVAELGQTFLGSINFSELDSVQEDYGIATSISATVNTAEEITGNQYIGYDGKVYRVIKSVPFDSHFMLILKYAADIQEGEILITESEDYIIA